MFRIIAFLGKMRLKYIFYIISFISILLLIIYKFNINNDVISYEKKHFSFDHDHDLNEYRVVKSNEWIFNFNVTQYSSILIGGGWNKDATIEALVFFDTIKKNENFADDIKCFIRSNDQSYLVELIEMKLIRLMHIEFFPKLLYKCTCKLNKTIHKNLYDHIGMAIVDITYFNYYKSIFNNDQLLLSLQKPDFINKTLSKKKQVANCVHMLARIDDATSFSKVNNWLGLQHEIGIAKVKMYLFDIDEIYIQKLKENYGKDYIELIKHSTRFEDVCGWQT
jgi:hypothetical protein